MGRQKSTFRLLWRLVQQFACVHTKRFRDLLNDGDRWIARSAFEIADVGTVDAGLVGKGLLRQARFKPQAA